MSESQPTHGQHIEEASLWRGVDFSGLTVVLGVGTGRLINLLNEEVVAAQGRLIVLGYNLAQIKTLAPLQVSSHLTLMQGRPRQIPVLSEAVDLLVVNGVLREVPENRLDVMFEELWRVLVPGGRLRISDIIEPSEAAQHHAWAERNRIVRRLGQALEQPTALSVNLPRAAAALRAVGFENPNLALLPGYVLTDAWLEETVNAMRAMAARVTDRPLRNAILNQDLKRLVAAYAEGEQRAAQRFVLRATKVGELALDMEASFTEDDLLTSED
jgi:SAM-dependent methyltransferase